MANPTRSPLENAVTTNPNMQALTASGGGASGVQDWYVHIQTCDLMYMRNNQYNSTTSSTNTSPYVDSNYLDVRFTIQTIDEVWEDTAFSGELFQGQTLEMLTDTAASGGFGAHGVVNTSTVGIIRRPVRKDAAGTILDTTGICEQSGNLTIDQMPGAYDYTFDTSSQVNSNVMQVMGSLEAQCPTFFAGLVQI